MHRVAKTRAAAGPQAPSKGLASKARPSTVCELEAQEDALDINTGDLCTRSSEPALLFLHVDGPDVGSPSTYWHKDSRSLQVGSCVAVCFVQHSSSCKS